MDETFTTLNEFESTSENLLKLFDLFSCDFFQTEGIAPPAEIVDNVKISIRKLLKGK